MDAIKIAVNGAAGQMGQRLVALAPEFGFEVTGKFDVKNELGGLSLNPEVYFDVMLDFSSPDGVLQSLKTCLLHKKPLVIGTTGLIERHTYAIDDVSKQIPVVQTSNYSTGINMFFGVLPLIARILGPSYDIEIIEAHHKKKKDAPSGTAVKIGQILSGATGKKLDDIAVYARKGQIGEREPGTIGLQTIRGGDITGEHTIMFCGMGERVEIIHKASSRDTFAHGALRAAQWIKDKPAGLYDMEDVLGLNEIRIV
jgi:4-hydroxy-tetrahydrodipicolinate reductase